MVSAVVLGDHNDVGSVVVSLLTGGIGWIDEQVIEVAGGYVIGPGVAGCRELLRYRDDKTSSPPNASALGLAAWYPVKENTFHQA